MEHKMHYNTVHYRDNWFHSRD